MILLFSFTIALAEPSALEDLNDAKIEMSDFKNADLKTLEGLVQKAHDNEPKENSRFLPGIGWRPDPISLLEDPRLNSKLASQHQKLERIVNDIDKGSERAIDAMNSMPVSGAHAHSHTSVHAHAHRHGHGRGRAEASHDRQRVGHKAANAGRHTSLLETALPTADMNGRIADENKRIQEIMKKLTQHSKADDDEEKQHYRYMSLSKAQPSSLLEEKPVEQLEWYDQQKQEDYQHKDTALAKDEARLAQIAARLHVAHQKVDKDLAQQKDAEKGHPHSKIYERLRDIIDGKARPEHLRLHD